jgi:hypothetical protein
MVLEDHFSKVQVRFGEPSFGEFHEGRAYDDLLGAWKLFYKY